MIEYKAEGIPFSPEVPALLNAQAQQGWELVTCFPMPVQDGSPLMPGPRRMGVALYCLFRRDPGAMRIVPAKPESPISGQADLSPSVS